MMSEHGPAKLFRDKLDPDDWRVEFIDDEGRGEIAIFSGPRAEERAKVFADRYYRDFEVANRT